MAILYKHDSRLSPKQKVLCGNYGQSSIIYTIKKVSYRQIGRSAESIVEEWTKDFSKEMSIVQNKLQYMGNEIFIQNKRVCVKPLSRRLEAIQKLQPPTTVKGCSSF